MRKHGVEVEVLRAVDHDIATGVYPDMTEHGWATDEWPEIHERVMASDILVLAGPIWLGDNTSVTKQVIERLYGASSDLNEPGAVGLLRPRRRLPDHRQRGRHQALRPERPLLPAAHRLHHPAAGRRRLDRRGRPGPSYLDEGSGGPENDFTNRNTTFMTWNLMHLARMLKDAGGIPAYGNQRTAWDAGDALRLREPRVPLTRHGGGGYHQPCRRAQRSSSPEIVDHHASTTTSCADVGAAR